MGAAEIPLMEYCVRKNSGFTLIELMIVIAIIALIAAIAIPNMLRARMATNEATAVAACKTYAEAQDLYRRTDYDSDGVLEYALAFKGNNSLFEQNAGSGDLTLVDNAFASAEGEPGTVPAKSGYVFLILTGQGANAPGGSQTYFVDVNMTMGYALSAVPASYDGTGRNSFQINATGNVYQSDRGSANTTHLTIYEPDSTWASCQ